MRDIHIFLRTDSRKGAKRWSYRSLGRTPQDRRAKASAFCAARNRAEGRT